MADDVTAELRSRLDAARGDYNKRVLAAHNDPTQAQSFAVGWTGDRLLVRGNDGTLTAKQVITNGAIGLGDPVTVSGDTANATPRVKRQPKINNARPEIDLEITFESIGINSQPFMFTVNGRTREIAYDLAQRFDVFGRGLITLPMRTRDRKLKMTLHAENTGGNLDTSVNAFFYPARVRNLDVTITCETQVENWYSNNPQPDSRFVNWLILDDFKLPTQDFFSFLDTATLAYPPYPASASGFVNDGIFGTIDAEKIVGKLNGTISQGGQNSGASIFIFAPFTAISTLSDVDAFTYTTTYTFTFK